MEHLTITRSHQEKAEHTQQTIISPTTPVISKPLDDEHTLAFCSMNKHEKQNKSVEIDVKYVSFYFNLLTAPTHLPFSSTTHNLSLLLSITSTPHCTYQTVNLTMSQSNHKSIKQSIKQLIKLTIKQKNNANSESIKQ